MKKCCNKLLVPKIRYKASIIDSIGLTILLGFFLSIASLIAFGLAAALVSDVEDGTFGDRTWFGRNGGGILLLFFGLYKLLPKVINACSYLVNYKLTVKSICKICCKEHSLIDLPNNDNPF
jgi:hypothetical protein